MRHRPLSLALFGCLLAAAAATSARDEPRAKHDGKPKQAKAAPAKPEPAARTPIGNALSAGKPERPGGPHKPGKATPAPEAREHPGRGPAFRGAMRELRDSYADGKVPPQELGERLKALRDSRSERRQQHRAALKERWGERLTLPDARQELLHHERRMAQLNRMLLLATTERSDQAKQQLCARIEKLQDRENQRHERKMASLGAASDPKGSLAAAKAGEQGAAPATPQNKGGKP
jgi:hypothetical protein